MKIVQDPDIYSTWGVHGPFIQNWVFKCCYLVIIHVLTQLVPLRACSLVALRIHVHMFVWTSCWSFCFLSSSDDLCLLVLIGPFHTNSTNTWSLTGPNTWRSNLRLSVSRRWSQLQSIFSLHTKLHAHMYFYYWSTFIAKTVLLTFETFTRVLFIRVTYAFPK